MGYSLESDRNFAKSVPAKPLRPNENSLAQPITFRPAPAQAITDGYDAVRAAQVCYLRRFVPVLRRVVGCCCPAQGRRLSRARNTVVDTPMPFFGSMSDDQTECTAIRTTADQAVKKRTVTVHRILGFLKVCPTGRAARMTASPARLSVASAGRSPAAPRATRRSRSPRDRRSPGNARAVFGTCRKGR